MDSDDRLALHTFLYELREQKIKQLLDGDESDAKGAIKLLMTLDDRITVIRKALVKEGVHVD